MVARNLEDKELLYSTLEEASKKYPAYQNIYIEAMVARLPKWGGSPEEVEKIARMAAEKTKINRDFLTTLISGVMQSITNLN